MNFLLAVNTLWKRELIRFFRQRSRVVGALGTPFVFWLLIGSGIGASFQPPSSPSDLHYLEYFFPGSLLLIILFTAIFSTISVIEDRREGFLLSVLVAPLARSGMIMGKILGGATLAVVQGLLFLLLAPLVPIPLSLSKILLLTGVLFLIAFSLTALGFAFAWQIDSTQGYHAVMNLVLFPMWLLSGALFPTSGASSWVGWIMSLNPLTYGLAAVRHVLYEPGASGTADIPSLGVSLGLTGLFGLVVFGFSFAVVRRPGLRGLA